ncbi:hypothetical protein D9M71_60830 [compost metagenome]
MGTDDEVVQALLGFDRWVDRVEDIAGDQQHVRLAQGQLPEQPDEKAGMFEVTLLAVQVLPQVPVGGVEQTHEEFRNMGSGHDAPSRVSFRVKRRQAARVADRRLDVFGGRNGTDRPPEVLALPELAAFAIQRAVQAIEGI